MDQQWFGNDVFHAKSRIERSEGILKNNLEIASHAAHLAETGGQKIVAFKMNAARGGLDQSEDKAAKRALA